MTPEAMATSMGRVLSDHDLAYLVARGISAPQAERYGLHTLSPEDVHGLLGRNDVHSGALAFPYPQYNGESSLVRVRLHTTLVGADGKRVRYLQAKNTPIRPFVTHLAAKYRQGTSPLIITEGEAKGLAAEAAGLAAIAIPGCWGWVAPRERNADGSPNAQPPVLHPAFSTFRWAKRPVLLVPDSDVVTNPKIHRAFLTLAAELQKLGAIVRIVIIPQAADGGKVGLDDLLAHRGLAEFERLAQEAPLADSRSVEQYVRQHGLNRALVLEAASSLTVQHLEYLWADRIPLGMESLIVGVPDRGKTFLGLEICARLTRGQLPGKFLGSPKPVLVTSVEDHKRAVLLPRLLAAGADTEKVFFISGPENGSFLLPDHLPLLANAFRATGAVLAFIDPLVAHLDGRINSWKDQDVRKVTAPLAGLAEDLNVTPIGVVHLSRRESADVLTRIGGSGGWGAAARSVLVVAEDPEDLAYSVVAQAKLNVGPKPASLRFRIESRTVEGPGGTAPTAALVWAGTSIHQADDLLANRGTPEERSELGDAKAWLLAFLAAGPVDSQHALREARTAGIAERTLRRAKADLHVRSVHREDEGKHRKTWMWVLPDYPAKGDGQVPPYGNVGNLGSVLETRVITESTLPKSEYIAKGIEIGGESSSPPSTEYIANASPPHGDLPPIVRKAIQVFDAQEVEVIAHG